MAEENRFELDESFSLKADKSNFTLIEKIPGTKWADKGKTIKEDTITEKLHHYGTLYQALSGYLFHTTSKARSLKDVRKLAIRVMGILEDSADEIKEQFRTEVKTVKP